MTEYKHKHKHKLPVIEPDDYAAFKKVLGSDFSKEYSSYSEWLDLRGQWEARHRSEGCIVVDVKVSSIQFSTYLKTASRAGDLNELLTFTDGITICDRD